MRWNNKVHEEALKKQRNKKQKTKSKDVTSTMCSYNNNKNLDISTCQTVVSNSSTSVETYILYKGEIL